MRCFEELLRCFGELGRMLGTIFVPCLLWNCIPPFEDLWMTISFLCTQLAFYFLHNIRGMVFICTVVLVIWTKNSARRWYESQALTREFFQKLLYLVMTIMCSVLAMVYLWPQLYDMYDCMLPQLSKRQADMAVRWKEHFFLYLAITLASISIAQSDLMRRPDSLTRENMIWLCKEIFGKISHFISCFFMVIASGCKILNKCMIIMNSRLARTTNYIVRGRDDPNFKATTCGLDVKMEGLMARLRRQKSDLLKRPMQKSSMTSVPGNENDIIVPESSESTSSLIQSTSELLQTCVVPSFISILGNRRTAAYRAARKANPMYDAQEADGFLPANAPDPILQHCLKAPGLGHRATLAESNTSSKAYEAGDTAAASTSVVLNTSELLRHCVIPEIARSSCSFEFKVAEARSANSVGRRTRSANYARNRAPLPSVMTRRASRQASASSACSSFASDSSSILLSATKAAYRNSPRHLHQTTVSATSFDSENKQERIQAESSGSVVRSTSALLRHSVTASPMTRSKTRLLKTGQGRNDERGRKSQ